MAAPYITGRTVTPPTPYGPPVREMDELRELAYDVQKAPAYGCGLPGLWVWVALHDGNALSVHTDEGSAWDACAQAQVYREADDMLVWGD